MYLFSLVIVRFIQIVKCISDPLFLLPNAIPLDEYTVFVVFSFSKEIWIVTNMAVMNNAAMKSWVYIFA